MAIHAIKNGYVEQEIFAGAQQIKTNAQMILEALCDYAKNNGYNIIYRPINDDMIMIRVGPGSHPHDSMLTGRQLVISYNSNSHIEFIVRIETSESTTTMVRLVTVDPSDPDTDLKRELNTAYKLAAILKVNAMPILTPLKRPASHGTQ